MKPMVLAGIVLAVLGVAALAYQGFSYTSRDTVLKVGDLKVDTEREKSVSLPPAVGIAAVVGGVVLIAVGLRTGR
jgi:drug/metabolite transporter (DMT)-like permease